MVNNMSIFLTIISGVIVFVIGQTILKLFVEPWQTQRECIAKISNNLLLYANVYGTVGATGIDETKIISVEIRKLAAELIASCNRIPYYEQIAKTKIFPSFEIILKVQKNLIGLANSLNNGDSSHNQDRAEEIKNLLNIKFD